MFSLGGSRRKDPSAWGIRIAKALDIDVATIRQKRDHLDGICPEVVDLLKECRATGNALREL